MLDGLRVLDCSDPLGWLAGRMLADLGAEVVKVEPPDAELGAADWQACNANKRLLRLDPGRPRERDALAELLAHADILIETAAPGSTQAELFRPDVLRARNPRLIQVSIRPFGADGPRAHWQASDLELMAAGGMMSLAGEPDGAPMRVSSPQASLWAGAQAAVGALVALAHRGATGGGQQVEVSAQAAVLTALAHAPTFYDLLGEVPTRCGEFITGRTLTGARMRAFWPCRDGYINFVLYGGAAGRRSNQQLADWMCETGVPLGAVAAVDWSVFDPKPLTQAQVDELERPILCFFSGLTKREFLEGAAAREMLGYPVSTVEDIATDPQLEARGFWDDLRSSGGGSERHCGSFALVDGKRAPLRHAPGEPVALEALLAEYGACVREPAAVTAP